MVQALALEHLSPHGVDKLLVQSSFLFKYSIFGQPGTVVPSLVIFALRSLCHTFSLPHVLFVSSSTFDRAFNQLFFEPHIFTTIFSTWAGTPFQIV
jgi:hypothetical protein